MYSRRDFGKIALAASALPTAFGNPIDSSFNGVTLGTTTYSFQDLRRTTGEDNVDDIIEALTACGIGEIELYSANLEPTPSAAMKPAFGPSYGGAGASGGAGARTVLSGGQLGIRRMDRENLRRWRLTTPASHYQAIRRRFEDAGIHIFAYALDFADDFADDEIEAGFQQAKALSVEILATSTTPAMAQRVAPFAVRHGIRVAVRNSADFRDPDRFATPESFKKAMAMNMRINLDIGQFTAANYDAVAYIGQNHENITHLHIGDRKRNHGANEPFGDGDTPVREVLVLIRDNKWPLRAFVEYEYAGMGSSVEEVKKCLDYMRACLAS
jgi:sugar phosphate isomerase/epimerase